MAAIDREAQESIPVDAVVMAGGRIAGLFARAAGTSIKALVPVGGVPVVRRVTEALRRTTGVARICVVGPDAVRDVLDEGMLWEKEAGSALANLLAGARRLDVPPDRRLLVCGADVPVLAAAALEDFLARASPKADISLPVVRREAFAEHFPGDLAIYVRLMEGSFTGGGQLLARPGLLQENAPLVERLFARRKSQLAMAGALGLRLIGRLVTGRLRVTELEQRLSELTGCRCRAVMDCRPELAYDIDSLLDLRYIEKWYRSRSLSAATPRS